MFEPCSVSGWHSRGSRGASGHLPASLFSIVPASACDALHAARSPSNCAEMRILFVRRYLHSYKINQLAVRALYMSVY